MTYYKSIIYSTLIGFTLLLGSCTEGFDEMNRDPNNPTKVPTSYLLSAAQTGLVEELMGRHNAGANWNLLAMRYMQHWSSTLYTDNDRYLIIEGDFSRIYNGGLRDLEEIIRLNTLPELRIEAAMSGANSNQIGVAKILRAWAFHNMTDIWGDVPYSEALKDSENVTPAYDPQEQIYDGIIAELNEAYAMIDEQAVAVKGDLIYNGDMGKWKRFAQSLKLRLGMRLTEVAPAKAEMIVKEALQAGIFSSNDHDATYVYEGSVPHVSPWFNEFVLTTITFAVTNTMIDRLVALKDPRLPFFAERAQELGTYVGMPYGVNAAIAGSIRNEEVSLPANRIIRPTFPSFLQTYEEVLFLKTEAAARGWLAEDPALLYREAVSASLAHWGVTGSAIEAYLNQPEIAYDAGNFRKSIGDQKWLALYLQGMESWAEWRRLDYPELVKAPDAASGREIPRRKGYPITEISLNLTSYTAAVSRQGPDDMGTRVWWDK
jgi:hypothetical protein